MSWNTENYTQHCEKCNAEYQVLKQHQPVRERGVFNCTDCGHEIVKWNGGVDYTFTKVTASE